MKVLVLTSEPISTQQLRAALPSDVAPERGEVMIVAPALQDSPIKFWVSDADAAIARAQEVQAKTAEQLAAEGVSASGDTGESDPVKAIEDALGTFAADRIVLFTGSGRYREDLDPDEVRERFGLPVDQASITG